MKSMLTIETPYKHVKDLGESMVNEVFTNDFWEVVGVIALVFNCGHNRNKKPFYAPFVGTNPKP